jgi:hypothetical protein
MSKPKTFSTKGKANYGYLGRFNKQKFLDEGHNNILGFFQNLLKFSEGPLGSIVPEFSASRGFKREPKRPGDSNVTIAEKQRRKRTGEHSR